ncbi:ATP-binding cassette domain-containing protein [Curtobacterium flaccumfaciens]|nr:ATP-binding cassette domain-containing protein [Curtobacterium flaccumfaciens]
MSSPLLEVEGLRVAFGDAEPVVRDVSFALTPGRVLALVGESGSGKSVSAMSVLGLLPPEAHVSGNIRFRGSELVGAADDELRAVRGAGIGVVFQEPMNSFTPVLSIGTQIAEAVAAHPTDLDRTGISAGSTSCCVPPGSPIRSGSGRRTRTNCPADSCSGR